MTVIVYVILNIDIKYGSTFVPSNIRTAVGKSFTRRAARRAATITEGAGTRS